MIRLRHGFLAATICTARAGAGFSKENTASPWLELIARLRTGVDPGQAAAAATAIFAAQTTNGPRPSSSRASYRALSCRLRRTGLGLLRRAICASSIRAAGRGCRRFASGVRQSCRADAGRSTSRRKEVAMRVGAGRKPAQNHASASDREHFALDCGRGGRNRSRILGR